MTRTSENIAEMDKNRCVFENFLVCNRIIGSYFYYYKKNCAEIVESKNCQE